MSPKRNRPKASKDSAPPPGKSAGEVSANNDSAREDPVGLKQRLEFLQLEPADAARLRSLAAALEPQMTEFVERFYEHLFAFGETSRFLRNPELVARLKQSQRDHFQSMLAAPWDEDYSARRRRVGDVHAQVGIEPHLFLGAYNQYLQFALRALAETQPGAPPEYIEAIGSLWKAVMLDVGLTLHAYFQQATLSLRQALDMVWQANHELRQFAQFTSHDLKTPLATVANLCDEALDEFAGQMPAAARELIEAARNRTFRMSRMIDELLSSTISLEPGDAGEEEPGGVSSELALTEAIDRVRPILDEKRIELVLPAHFPRVAGDRVRIREAFYNLLSNAAKFIERRPGRIEVSVESRGPVALFVFADNGPGIPAEELERIFVPFRRLPMHRDRPGSGLGLYFTKNLVEQQGGRVWAESEPGRGSRFFVQLNLPATEPVAK